MKNKRQELNCYKRKNRRKILCCYHLFFPENSTIGVYTNYKILGIVFSLKLQVSYKKHYKQPNIQNTRTLRNKKGI